MMNIETVKEVFEDKINAERIIVSENVSVPIDFFVDLFKGVEKITYDNLIEADGGRLGYKPFFDKCKEQGILD